MLFKQIITKALYSHLISNNFFTRRSFHYKNPFAEVKGMPRNQEDIEAMREIRIKNKKLCKTSRFPPGQIYLCVLGNGSVSSSRALYIFTDHERYLFNCGEGTQRYAVEHKTKLSKLEHIFITHNKWENTGGLPGMFLTLQDMGVPEITLHGPPKLDLLFNYAKTFAVYKNLEIKTREYKNEKFSDSCLEVQYIPIFPSSQSSEFSYNSSSTDSSDSSDEDTAAKPKIKKFKYSSDKKSNKDVCVAYACKGYSKPGHLLYEKCVELGVPAGPLLGDLKNGKDITLPSGKVVHSKDVVSEEQHCPQFLVVECPSFEFLHSFVNENTFQQFQKNPSAPFKVASLVVHFTPPGVLKTPEYQKWMNKFPVSTIHLILNSDNATLTSTAVHRIQHKLNLIYPKMFNLLYENEVPKEFLSSVNNNIIQANTLERFHLRPANGLDRTTALKMDVKEFVNEALVTKGFKESVENFKSKLSLNPLHSTNEADSFPIITFLGTGSSIPSKARNVSAILINTSKNNHILLDCGEGTCSQLIRLYGKDYEKILVNLSCIFISHIHADHHLGLLQLLKTRSEVFKKLNKNYEIITIIGPKALKAWLKYYCKHIEKLSHPFNFVECSQLKYNQQCDSNDLFETFQISTVPVIHCYDSHGIIVVGNNAKWKLVYSGDTRPCGELVTAGKNCSLLIHEATMEDELIDEACYKKHSTISEAIKIGIDMNANYTILTHFSQRYAKIPLFNENFHNRVGCAFDNMTIHMNHLYVLPLLIPTLKCLFAEDVEDMNVRGDKRRKRIKLMESALKISNNV